MTDQFGDYRLDSGAAKHESTEYKRDIRQAITENVGDTKDLIADSYKLHSVFAELILSMYDALPENIRNNMDEEYRLLMDYVIRPSVGAGSRYRQQREEEGYNFLFRIIERQKDVSDLMESMHYETYKGVE